MIPKLQKRPKRKRQVTLLGIPVPMGELREFVFWRDGGCLAKRFSPGHVCQGDLTLEHVLKVHDVTDGRQDNERHTVTLCHGLNGISIASMALRQKLRDHLRALYPECERG
jgi:hypothetical protein